jgi:AraC family transcriptional regulator
LRAGDAAWSTVFAHDVFALHMGGTIFEETIKPEAERRTAILHHLAEALCAHLMTQYGLHHAAGPDTTLGETDAIRRVVERLKRKTHDFPDLASMAEMAGLSRFHFSRLFKAETGLSPVQFVERCRIEQAKVLIEAADLPLTEIAARLDFSDQSHFTKRFKKIVGSTPAAFARTHARRRRLPD